MILVCESTTSSLRRKNKKKMDLESPRAPVWKIRQQSAGYGNMLSPIAIDVEGKNRGAAGGDDPLRPLIAQKITLIIKVRQKYKCHIRI